MRVMFGSRGCARDAYWLLHEVRHAAGDDRLDAFIAADGAEEIGSRIRDVRIVGEGAFFAAHRDDRLELFIGIGTSALRQRVHGKCRANLPNARYPSLLHPSVRYDRRDGATHLGNGIMICAGTTLTTEVTLGDFVHVNLHCTIAHCTTIGAFSTLSPGCHIAGGVVIGEGCFIGAGAVVNENVRIAARTVIGAGATVVQDITLPGTYVGTPARLLVPA